MKVADIQNGPIRHPVLPDAFIERVKNFKQVLAEVEKTSLDSTLENFQRDEDPETELLIWEHIASIYQWSVVANEGLSVEQKKEVLSILLSLSMDMNDFSDIKKLTKETIDEIVDRYQYV